MLKIKIVILHYIWLSEMVHCLHLSTSKDLFPKKEENLILEKKFDNFRT